MRGLGDCRMPSARATYGRVTGAARPKNRARVRDDDRCRSPSGSLPRASATFARVSATYAGSLRLPRNGTGARYGASDSTRRRSSGMERISSSSVHFLKVTIPLNETYQPAESATSARLAGPVKQ